MPRDTLILEGIVTTVSADGEVNIAPMGPRVDHRFQSLTLRPYQTAQTYKNLKAHGEGVFHVIDDVLLLAQATINAIKPPPTLMMARQVRGHIIQEACRYFEFKVVKIDDSHERAEIDAAVVDQGRFRDFFGFNRAKHAVVEAAILASRVHLLPRNELLADLKRFEPWVEKTGGSRERQAFDLLVDYVTHAPAAGVATP